MSTKALKSQLLAAVAMVLVSSIALGSSTYAWFAMNNKVTATGMAVTTQVANNLFIAEGTLTDAEVKADSAFKTSLVKDISATLEPVSTINAANFYYTSTKNVQADGNAFNDVYTALTGDGSGDTAFNQNYLSANTGAQGYVDYVFQLKAINSSGTDKDLKLTKLNLTYGGTDEVGVKAFRAGVFIKDIGTAAGNSFTAGAGDVTAIYAYDLAGTTNFDGKAVKDTTSLDAVTYNAPATQTVAKNSTKYYQVVVRLWLEGEDKLCNNTTFAQLSNEWSLDVGFELGGENAAVAKLTTKAFTADLTDPGVTLSSDTVVVNSVTYTKIEGVELDSKVLYVQGAGPISNTSRIFVMEDNMYPIEVTNQCKLPTPVGP